MRFALGVCLRERGAREGWQGHSCHHHVCEVGWVMTLVTPQGPFWRSKIFGRARLAAILNQQVGWAGRTWAMCNPKPTFCQLFFNLWFYPSSPYLNPTQIPALCLLLHSSDHNDQAKPLIFFGGRGDGCVGGTSSLSDSFSLL